MKIGPLAILAAILSSSLPALAHTGSRAGNEIDMSLSITTDDRGQVTTASKDSGRPGDHAGRRPEPSGPAESEHV